MLVRRAAFCGAIASAALAGLPVIALLAGSPSHAAEDELALAREYWRLDALFGGYAVAKQDELETAARNLIRFCSDTPATQMPREKLLTCLMLGKRRRNLKRLGKGWKRRRSGSWPAKDRRPRRNAAPPRAQARCLSARRRTR